MQSYLDRLAHGNRLDTGDLRAYLAGDKRGRWEPVNVAALSVLAGLPEAVLRRAMPELSSAAELAVSPWVLGRARPHAAVEGPACRRCAAGRSALPVVRWHTHEDVICVRHQLWTQVPAYHSPRAQLDLRDRAEIVAANRWHRRLIRRFGRPAVHFAFEQARRICAEWHLDRHMRLDGVGERLEALCGRDGARWGEPACDAAFYPHAVALSRLLASPGWSGPILDEHASHSVAVVSSELSRIDAEVSRLWPEASSEKRRLLREAVLLETRPGTRRFASEVRRTVAPDYVWLPVCSHGKFEPLAEWVQGRATAQEDIFGNSPHRPPPAEVYQAEHLPGLT